MADLQNPFLRGLLASQAAGERSTANQIGMMQGLLGAQNQQRQQALAEQMAPLQLKLMQAQVAGAENPAPIMKDLGGAIGIFDPRTFQQIGTLPKSATPDAAMREQGAMQRHAIPGGAALLSAETAMRGQDIGAATSRRGQDITLRGQNMVDARARENLLLGRTQYDPQRGGIVNLGSGEFRPATQGGVPIEPVKKPLTEAQGRASMFGTRAASSDKILNSLEESINVPGLAVKQAAQELPLIGGMVGAGANVLLSDNQQRVEQAQRDFVNATLRQESGAVISPQEFENAKKQYFPQPGDSKAVIEQKRANRQLVIQGFGRMSGSPIESPSQQERRQGGRRQDDLFNAADAILGIK